MAYGDVTIKTTVLPDVKFTPGKTTTVQGFDVGKYLKPAVYVEQADGSEAVLYAPYGTPENYSLYVGIALLVLLFLALRGIK
jgi:hypothetical protein